jgi:hypothetical protein
VYFNTSKTMDDIQYDICIMNRLVVDTDFKFQTILHYNKRAGGTDTGEQTTPKSK